MTYVLPSQFLSAETLVNDAADLLFDAAAILKDAGDGEGEQDLCALNDSVARAAEKLRQKRIAAATKAFVVGSEAAASKLTRRDERPESNGCGLLLKCRRA
jgi:hypothetical protein